MGSITLVLASRPSLQSIGRQSPAEMRVSSVIASQKKWHGTPSPNTRSLEVCLLCKPAEPGQFPCIQVFLQLKSAHLSSWQTKWSGFADNKKSCSSTALGPGTWVAIYRWEKSSNREKEGKKWNWLNVWATFFIFKLYICKVMSGASDSYSVLQNSDFIKKT